MSAVRKLDAETRKEVAGHLQLNANKKLFQQSYREKTGKNILMKDFHNIAMASKLSSTIATSASEVQGLADWLKEKYPGIYCEFATNERSIHPRC